MSWLERLSLASMISANHKVELYTENRSEMLGSIKDIDSTIEVVDVRDVLRRNPVIDMYFNDGRFNLYSDIVRLALLKFGRGMWADADCIFLKNISDNSDYIMGWSHPETRINNAVLLMPQSAPVLKSYWEAVTSSPVRVPWATNHIWLKRELEILLGYDLPRRPSKMSIGPRALTYFVHRHHLESVVSKKERFYPIDQSEAPLLIDPNSTVIEEKITSETDIIHAWRGNLATAWLLSEPRPVDGSFLGRKYSELFGRSY